VALLAIVAVGAAGSLDTDPAADRTAARIATFPLLALLGAAAAAAVMTTVLARRRLLTRIEDDDEEADAGGPGSRLLRIALLLLPLAVVGALIFAIAVRPRGEAQPQPPSAPPPAGAPATRGGGERDDWGLVALAGGALAATAFFGSAVWGARPRRRPGIAPLRGPAADPRGAVDDALAALDAETDPRRAIIAAYVRMERALDVAGLGRREPEAPREYLARVAGALRGDARAARRLTALYEEARFSAHPLDEGMRAEAVAALRALRAEAAA
jgi:hypothetical protein